MDYDVLDYRLNVRFDPEREWLDGFETLSVRVKAPLVSTLTLRLDERLTVRAVSSPDFGRLMHLRVRGQNNLIVNLPAGVLQGTDLEFTICVLGPPAAAVARARGHRGRPGPADAAARRDRGPARAALGVQQRACTGTRSRR